MSWFIRSEPSGSRDSRASDVHLILAPLTLVIVVAVLAAIGGYFFLTASTPEVVLPNVIGKKYEDASQEFRKLGLLIEIIPENGPDTAIGTVLRMQPAQGSRVKPGRPVILYVASGEGMVAVPDLVGTYFIEADNRLKRAGLDKGFGGLLLGAKASEISDSPAGMIISQNPAAGQMSKVGSLIDIVIAVSKVADTMPNFVSMLLPDAKEIMAAKGYSIDDDDVENFFTTSKPANTIISQKPSPGTKLGPATRVKVTVARSAVGSPDQAADGAQTNGATTEQFPSEPADAEAGAARQSPAPVFPGERDQKSPAVQPTKPAQPAQPAKPVQPTQPVVR